jgi:leucyl aminopeptidase
MDFDFKPLSLEAAITSQTDALVVLWPDDESNVPLAAGAAAALLDWVRRAAREGLLDKGLGKTLGAALHPACAAPRLMVVRAGDGTPACVQKATLAAMSSLKGAPVGHAVLYLGLLPVRTGAVRAAVVAAAEATYTYTTTLSKSKGRALKAVTLACSSDGRDGSDPQAAAHSLAAAELQQGQALVSGIEWAKEWANRPGNHATPTHLAQAAESLATQRHVKVDILGPKEVAKLGMGAFMAVAQGSAQPLRFIVIRYEGGPKSQSPVVLVGKGITFDTGGISIKPAPEMDEMKFDMGGAASVLGTLRAVAALQPRLNVIGLIPSCENMPDGMAIKPGDVVTSMNGTTIEILNTDAEGRLILCDALSYAERFKPRAVIDIATLTGACVIALGHVRSGLFSPDDALALALSQAGDAALDPCWRMPLDEAYAEGLKTHFADVANVGGRAGGAITAAKFLQKFATTMPWAHLDIAGTAWKSGAAKGSTGRPVGLLVQYLLSLAEEKTPFVSENPSEQKTSPRPPSKGRGKKAASA